MKNMIFTGLSDWIYDPETGIELNYAKDRYLAKNCPLKVKGQVVGEVRWVFKVQTWDLPFYAYIVEISDTSFFELDEADQYILQGAYTVKAEVQSFDGEEVMVVYQLELCTPQAIIEEIEEMVQIERDVLLD